MQGMAETVTCKNNHSKLTQSRLRRAVHPHPDLNWPSSQTWPYLCPVKNKNTYEYIFTDYFIPLSITNFSENINRDSSNETPCALEAANLSDKIQYTTNPRYKCKIEIIDHRTHASGYQEGGGMTDKKKSPLSPTAYHQHNIYTRQVRGNNPSLKYHAPNS